MEEALNLRKKAELISGGGILLPEGFVMPYRVSRSTAGPGAGSSSAVFSFDGFRVKKPISYDSGEFELRDNDTYLSMTRNGSPFLDKVEIQPVVFHCPEQAFFNLDQRCMYNCAFCASPRLNKDTVKGLTEKTIVELVKNALKTDRIVSVSITSGVVDSVDATVNKFVSCVKALKAEFPDLPIGIEPYIGSREHLLMLKDAGADEIKLNIESPSEEIFKKVCPELEYDLIFKLLKDAVPIFGKGMVTSNIIFGMGETDKELMDVSELLCSKGIIPTLRALRITPLNTDQLKDAIGTQPPITPERSIDVANMLKKIMERYDLDTRKCHTMCIECGCCDIIPFRDL
jgi:Lipoate synthase